MKLSVFILTHHRLALLKTCLRSVLAALPRDCEVIVVVNGPQPVTTSWLNQIADSRLQWTEISEEHPGKCRNLAFDLCRGEMIHFLDDDVVVPEDIFRNVIAAFNADSELAVLGGPNLTPTDSSWNEKLYGAMMTTRFVAPMVCRRYSEAPWKEDAPASERELILCNLALRQTLIPPAVRFRDRLVCNEENLFLYHCRKRQLKIRFSSLIPVEHRRRGQLERFLAQILRYGTGRGQQTMVAPLSCHPAFLVPGMCVLLGAFWLVSAQWAILSGTILCHFGLSLQGALKNKEMRSLGWRAIAVAVPLTGLVHFYYGVGFWAGSVRGIPLALAKREATSS